MSQMTIQMALEDLYTRWFRAADTDGDGRVSGGEAVAFFMTKSGLPQATLGQVWDAGTNGEAFLDQGSFRRVCQLIWYAQVNGNVLPADSQGVVMKIVSGMAVLPPPRLAGMDTPFALRDMKPIGVDMPQAGPAAGYTGASYGGGYTGYSSAATGVSATHSTGAATPTPPQPAAQRAPLPADQFHSGVTGAVPMQPPATSGSFGVAATGQPEFPGITNDLATKYGATHKEAAKTAAGGVGGREVLRLLASVPVDNAVKKEAWDVVAGTRGELTTQEFFTLLYLLDLHSVQQRIPRELPAGVFPPGVHLCYQAAGLAVPVSLAPPTVAHVPLAQQNPVENLALQAEGFRDQKWDMQQHAQKDLDPLAAMPRVPQKATFEAPDKAPPYDPAARMPSVDASKISALNDKSQAQRLEGDLKTAGQQDRALFQAEQAFASGQEEAAFYMAALQALTLFKSKSERALLDVQSRADGAQREAQEARQRYEQMYATARASAGNHEELQRHITEAMATKAEWESKVQVLQQELQSLANATPELLAQLEYEVEEIKGVVADMETEKQGYYDQTAGLRAAKAQLKERSAEVADVLRVAKGTREDAMIALNSAKQELDFTKSGEDAEGLIAALQEAAAAYKALHVKALGAGVKLPRSATIVSDERAVWQKDDLIGAQDWMHFESEGWALVEELPELPAGFDRTYFLSQQAGEPPEEIVPVVMSDDPFIEALDEASVDGDESEPVDTAAADVAAPTKAPAAGDAGGGLPAATPDAPQEAAGTAAAADGAAKADLTGNAVEADTAAGTLPKALTVEGELQGLTLGGQHSASDAAAGATDTSPAGAAASEPSAEPLAALAAPPTDDANAEPVEFPSPVLAAAASPSRPPLAADLFSGEMAAGLQPAAATPPSQANVAPAADAAGSVPAPDASAVAGAPLIDDALPLATSDVYPTEAGAAPQQLHAMSFEASPAPTQAPPAALHDADVGDLAPRGPPKFAAPVAAEALPVIGELALPVESDAIVERVQAAPPLVVGDAEVFRATVVDGDHHVVHVDGGVDAVLHEQDAEVSRAQAPEGARHVMRPMGSGAVMATEEGQGQAVAPDQAASGGGHAVTGQNNWQSFS